MINRNKKINLVKTFQYPSPANPSTITHGGATTNGPDATTIPQLSVKTRGGGGGSRGSGGRWGVFLPGVGGGGVWRGGQGGVQPGLRGGGVRVRVTELVEPVLVL